MRISTAYQFDAYTQSITTANESMFDAQNQVITGRRINKPSDDPFGMTSVLNMQALKSNLTQYTTNLNSAKSLLSYSDHALSDVTSLANQAYTLALNGANAATDQTGRNGMAQQITSIQQQILNLANTTGPSGQFIFGGQKNNTQPYAAVNGALVYSGDTNSINAEVGPQQTIATNVNASATLQNLYAQLESLKNNLTGGNTSAISGVDVANLQASITTVNQMRGDVGARLQSISNLVASNTRRSDELVGNISNVQDVDMASAISKYQSAQTAYQAALSVANQGFHLSLMDFLKI
jgi:flagellar hook-associated protein 3 FlgL